MWATDPMPAAAARLDALHERVAREEAYADRAQHRESKGAIGPAEREAERERANDDWCHHREVE